MQKETRAPITTAVRISFGHGLGRSLKGSAPDITAPSGSVATEVIEAPNLTLSLTRPFTAQPLASRIGPRLRWRSLSQAMSIAGAEMSSRMPAITSTSCQKGSWNIPAR